MSTVQKQVYTLKANTVGGEQRPLAEVRLHVDGYLSCDVKISPSSMARLMQSIGPSHDNVQLVGECMQRIVDLPHEIADEFVNVTTEPVVFDDIETFILGILYQACAELNQHGVDLECEKKYD